MNNIPYSNSSSSSDEDPELRKKMREMNQAALFLAYECFNEYLQEEDEKE